MTPPHGSSLDAGAPGRRPSTRRMRHHGRLAAAALLGGAGAVLAACAGAGAGTGTGPPAASASFDPSASSTLFAPDGASAADAPLIVLVPGGGWTSADPAGLTGLATWLSQHGAVVVTVTYRTSTDGAYYPTPAQDVACDVAAAVELAGREDVAFGDVVVAGHSAGAQLAALVALTPTAFSTGCAVPAVEPDRLIGLAGPYDVRQLGSFITEIFGPEAQDPTQWSAGNPAELAAERPDLPVLLVHGTSDDVVPASFTEEFAASLEAGGHPVTVRYPEGADHQSVYSPEVAGPLIADWLGLPD